MELYKLINSFCRNYPSIEESTLKTLFMSDPTFKQTDRGLYTGRYCVWIGRMYVNGYIKLGDAPELKAALVIYNKNKSQLPNIKSCESLSELVEWIKDLSEDFKPVRKQSNAKETLEKVYEDNEWIVYVPHSHAAARLGGKDSHWCTASESDYYYNLYSKQGPLYINVRKFNGEKFQFHFETNQFMDANDDPVKLDKIGLSKELIDFYSKIDPRFKFILKFDLVGSFHDGFAQVALNNKYNFITADGQLLSNQWFDEAWHFENGLVDVRLNNKWGLIKTNGKLFYNQWFDYIGNFREGFVWVELKNKYNFINIEEQLLSDQWFDAAWDFRNGFAVVQLNDMLNFINTKGQILSNQWFDWVKSFKGGFANVQLNDKWNFVNTEGQLLSQQWFDDVDHFHNGFAAICLNYKWNFINTNRQIISKVWFNYVGSFSNGFAIVKLNNKWNFINTNGKILSNKWFDGACDFNGKIAQVKLGDEWKFINADGKILSPRMLDYYSNNIFK